MRRDDYTALSLKTNLRHFDILGKTEARCTELRSRSNKGWNRSYACQKKNTTRRHGERSAGRRTSQSRASRNRRYTRLPSQTFFSQQEAVHRRPRVLCSVEHKLQVRCLLHIHIKARHIAEGFRWCLALLCAHPNQTCAAAGSKQLVEGGRDR